MVIFRASLSDTLTACLTCSSWILESCWYFWRLSIFRDVSISWSWPCRVLQKLVACDSPFAWEMTFCGCAFVSACTRSVWSMSLMRSTWSSSTCSRRPHSSEISTRRILASAVCQAVYEGSCLGCLTGWERRDSWLCAGCTATAVLLPVIQEKKDVIGLNRRPKKPVCWGAGVASSAASCTGAAGCTVVGADHTLFACGAAVASCGGAVTTAATLIRPAYRDLYSSRSALKWCGLAVLCS
mmetsp:Transcript_14354/g.42881  ORF Transcript_14354/g.42881 Transcript_14354/m.42881 type:complete len:240 (+) Transcript_14354:235-954(+)